MPPTLEKLAQMTIDEKIEMALAELEELDAKRFPWLHRKRRDQLTYALEAWWMTKGMRASNQGDASAKERL